MKKRVAGVVSLVILLTLTLTGILSTRQGAQEKNQKKDVPTVVYAGRITDKQRAYSKELRPLFPTSRPGKISQLRDLGLSRGNSAELGTIISEYEAFGMKGTSDPTADQVLKTLACGADSIVRATVSEQTASLMDDESFVFTTYTLTVKDVLKDNSGQISPSGVIEATRPGGLINFGGQIIRAQDRNYPPLAIGGEYLLFLKHVPMAGGYIVTSDKADFLIERDSSYTSLSPSYVPSELRKSADITSLIDNLRKSKAGTCLTPKNGAKQ